MTKSLAIFGNCLKFIIKLYGEANCSVLQYISNVFQTPSNSSLNGVLLGHLVQCREVSTALNKLKEIKILSVSILSVVLHDLHPFSNYHISVRAFNSAGYGPESPVINAKTKPKGRSNDSLLQRALYCVA